MGKWIHGARQNAKRAVRIGEKQLGRREGMPVGMWVNERRAEVGGCTHGGQEGQAGKR